MKIISVISIVFCTFLAIGQKSYYFSNPLPSGENTIRIVDKSYFGTYHSQSVARSYEFSASGINIITTSISSIGRESIRELSKYDVRNGFIFGVVEDDSLPCILEDDRYYFGINLTDELIGGDSKNVLTKINATSYIINFFDDGVYTPVLLIFDGKELRIEQFDYDLETTVFDFIEDQKSVDGKHHEMVILSPTTEEYQTLVKKDIFDVQGVFKRKKK
jgi:hypothetical protein